MAFEFEPSNPFNLSVKNSSGFQTMEQPGNGQEHPDSVATLEQKPFGWTDWAKKAAMKNGDYFEHDKKIFNQREGKTFLVTGDGMGDVELDEGQAKHVEEERQRKSDAAYEAQTSERMENDHQNETRVHSPEMQKHLDKAYDSIGSGAGMFLGGAAGAALAGPAGAAEGASVGAAIGGVIGDYLGSYVLPGFENLRPDRDL